jgi:alpha-L-fucosidase
VFTTKHHDGFALHDSQVTNYDAADITGRDMVREIVEACRAAGLKVGFYHSVIDWQHPQYDFTIAKRLPYPKDGVKLATIPRDHAKYIRHLHAQVDELISNYGKIDVLWWDYSSTEFDGDRAWQAGDLLQKVRAKQPAIVMNNRLYRRPEAGFTGMGTDAISNRLDPRYGDFITPEQHIPATGIPGVDWETCMTMNTSWGYSEHDKAWKSAATLVRNLIDIASKGGNYLLNIGPTGDGSVPPESAERMAAVGKWMSTNAESIRGTTASPFAKLPFDGRCTAQGETVYLHLFARPADGRIALAIKATTATLLATGETLPTRREGESLVLTLPATLPDAVATVVKIR